jgi:hypothetical protein
MARSSRATDWESKVALALGVGRIDWLNHRASDTGVRGILTVPCSRGHGVEIEMPTKFPHDVVKKKLMQQGWVFHGRKPVCPGCAEADRHKGPRPKLKLVPATPPPEQDLEPITPQPTVPEKEMTMETSATAIAAATSQQTLTPSAKAKAARREVMQWLDESFELTGPEKGRYKAGVTDATIAKESGCSEEAVRKIREEFFGVLDKPKELDGISAEVGNLRLAAAELEKRAGEHADRIIADAKAEADVIRGKAGKLAERLAQISREQGWS